MSGEANRDRAVDDDVVELSSRRDGERGEHLAQAVEAVLGHVWVSGNDVRVLRNGDEIFPAMLEAIEQAERTIDFVTFVYWTGDIARRFAHALAQRARNGLRVRIVLDGFGSIPMDQGLVEEMQAAGAMVERFRPVVRWKLWESDHRTHRKILVIDERIAFTGGVGIAEEWTGDARNPNEWRDTHFRIEGPAVLGLRAAFLTDWRDCGHPVGPSDVDLAGPPPAGGMPLAVVDGSAQIGVNDAERILEALVSAARERVTIQTPYFNPTPELVDLLAAARRRGVAVDVLVPGPHIDKRISHVVAQDKYLPLVDAGVRVWIYQPTMMHVKAVLVDGAVACVGSVNVNRRSVEKDEEVAVLVRDAGVVEQLERHFEEDAARSLPVSGDASPSLLERAVALVLKPLHREM